MKKLMLKSDSDNCHVIKRIYRNQLAAMLLSVTMIVCSLPECSTLVVKTFAAETNETEVQNTEIFEESAECMAAYADIADQNWTMEAPASSDIANRDGTMEATTDTDIANQDEMLDVSVDADIPNQDGIIEAPADVDQGEALQESYDEQNSWTDQDQSEMNVDHSADSDGSGDDISQDTGHLSESDITDEASVEEDPNEVLPVEEIPTEESSTENFADEPAQENPVPLEQPFETISGETSPLDPESQIDTEAPLELEPPVESDPFLTEDASIEESIEAKRDAIVRSGYCGDNVTWNLDDSGMLLISGEGNMYDYASKASPFYTMSEITSISIEEGVTDIGDYAFNGCSALTTVQIPLSLVRVGTGAFMDCTSLTAVYYAGSRRNWNAIAGGEECLSAGATLYPAIETEEVAIEECIVSGIQTKAYAGQEITQNIVVKDGDTELTEGLDYILQYKDNVNAGTATLMITGTGTYTGTIEKTFTIKPKSITPSVTLSKTTFVYNRKVQKPVVTVKDGTTKLATSDYTLTYSSGLKNAGTYKIIVKLKGNYTGTKTVSYKIIAKKSTPAVTLSKTSFVYNGKAQKPAVTVKDGTTKLATSDYTLTYSSGLKNAGTYKIIVRLKGNYTGTKTVSYKIVAKKITPAVTLSKTTFVYNGKAQKPAVTVKDGNTKLTTYNYTLTYSSGRKNVGTYKIIVKLKGNFSGTRTVSYKILPKGTSIASVTAGKNEINVKWKKQTSQITGYQIQYSAKSDFSKAITLNISKNSIVSKNIKNLTKGTTYYIRVRTYKMVGSTKMISSWSAKKSMRITTGTAAKFTKNPVIKVIWDGNIYKNTISWNKLQGATGYEVSYKKGDNGKWTVLQKVSSNKAYHAATHGIAYYYRVRAFKEKNDGSIIYGNYSNEDSMMYSYVPDFDVTTVDWNETSPFYIIAITNKGDYSLRVYSKNAKLVDRSNSSYNREMYLIDSDIFADSGILKDKKYINIAPGATETLTFWVKNDETWIDNNTTLFYEFRYDGVDHRASTSKEYGTSFKSID